MLEGTSCILVACSIFSKHDASHDDGWWQRQCLDALDDDDDDGWRRLAGWWWWNEHDVTDVGHGRWQRHVDENDDDDDDEWHGRWHGRWYGESDGRRWYDVTNSCRARAVRLNALEPA